MPSTSEPTNNNNIFSSSSLNERPSNVTDRLHADANTPQSATKQASRSKDEAIVKQVKSLDQYMEDLTDPQVWKEGSKDQKGT